MKLLQQQEGEDEEMDTPTTSTDCCGRDCAKVLTSQCHDNNKRETKTQTKTKTKQRQIQKPPHPLTALTDTVQRC